MKKTIWIGLCAWLLAMGEAAADNTLSVANVSIPQGGQATLEIVCNFENAFVGGQLDIELPDDGKITPTMSDGKPVITLGFTGTDHSLSNTQLKDAELNPVNSYRSLCASLSNSPLPTSGVLLRMTLNASADALEGTVYDAKLTGIEFGTKTDKYNLEDVPFTITIDNRIILSENDVAAPEMATDVDVRVIRTINANEWCTICLPFDMTTEQINTAFPDMTVELADADSYETIEDDEENIVGINIMFNNVEPLAIVANHPYLIRVSSPVTNFEVDGVDVNPATQERNRRVSMGNRSYFIGNYKNETKVPEFCLFLSGNKFWYSIGETKIKAFRGYFDLSDILTEVEEASSRIAFSFQNNGGMTTGIAEMEDGKWKTEDPVYDLTGRTIASGKSVNRKLPGGVYVKNGKKVVIK